MCASMSAQSVGGPLRSQGPLLHSRGVCSALAAFEAGCGHWELSVASVPSAKLLTSVASGAGATVAGQSRLPRQQAAVPVEWQEPFAVHLSCACCRTVQH